MKRIHLNALIDGLAFIAFLCLLTTGLLLEYQLPSGSGGAQGYGSGHGALDRPVFLVWGWTRHEWGQLHYWVALVMMVVLAFHLVLHWKWIVCTVRGKPSTASGYRLILGVVGLACAVLLAVAPLMSDSTKMSRGELRMLRTADDTNMLDELNGKENTSESLRGSMSLREISESSGIPVAKLVANLGLPANVDVDAKAGRLLRQHQRTMNDLRKVVDNLQSGTTEPLEKTQSKIDER